jgi:hypothetical protein
MSLTASGSARSVRQPYRAEPRQPGSVVLILAILILPVVPATTRGQHAKRDDPDHGTGQGSKHGAAWGRLRFGLKFVMLLVGHVFLPITCATGRAQAEPAEVPAGVVVTARGMPTLDLRWSKQMLGAAEMKRTRGSQFHRPGNAV